MLAVAIPTFFMGGTLPVLGEGIAPSGRHLGVSVGGLYAINVAGAAASVLAVPFLLLPRLGIRGATLAVAAGSLVVGAAACALGARSLPRVVESTPRQERQVGSDPASLPPSSFCWRDGPDSQPWASRSSGPACSLSSTRTP